MTPRAEPRLAPWGWPARWFDVAAVAAVVAVDLAGQVAVAVAADPGAGVRSAPLGPVPVALSLLCGAAFLWRRARPLTVVGAVVAGALLASAAAAPGLLSQQTGLTIALAAYAIGSWSGHRRRATAIVLLGALLLFSGAATGDEDGDGRADTSLPAAGAIALSVTALPWMAGTAARSRRLQLAAVEARLAAAERERDERARRAVLDERTRIARELHDVVAHHVSLIGVQAGAARTAIDHAPERAARALAAIESSSREAVTEMRLLLDALRDDGSPVALGPQPGLADLDRLAAGYRAAGLDVTLAVHGDPATVPPTAGLSAHRIVEEALTNVTRHSAAGRASVAVWIDAERVHVTVHDPGPARTGTSASGHGHVGMRERVAVFGGALALGPDPAGGYLVDAVLPITGASP